MKKFYHIILILFFLFELSGCKGKVNIEDITLSLILGIDMDDQGQVEMYMASPVFSKDAKEKNEVIKVKGLSLRDARNYFDTMVNGITSGGKVQSVLIGMKVLQEENWFDYLDLLYRDPKIRLNSDVIAVNGSVSEVFDLKLKDKPRLSIFIPQLVETANFRNVSVKTSLRKLYQMHYEDGIATYLPELKVENGALVLSGTSLLADGKYIQTLPLHETQLFKLLEGKLKGQFAFVIELNENKNKLGRNKAVTSFYVKDYKRNIEAKFKNKHYSFVINLKIPIEITESPYRLSDQSESKLKKIIDSKLQDEFNELIKTLQQNKIDPIGLGIIARATNYPEWKKIEDHWETGFHDSEIKVNVKTIIVDRGKSM